MKIKVNGRKIDFDPSPIEWRHQSSPLSHFGIWHAGKTPVFVKRVTGEPDGWALLKRCRGSRLGNSPIIWDTVREGSLHYIVLEHLEGDTLHSIFQKSAQKQYFGSSQLSEEARHRIILSLLETLNTFNSKGFWYPDLDFRNVFISPKHGDFQVFLIDLDSAVPLGRPFSPDHVSQRFWEGMAKTCQMTGTPFFKKGLDGLPHLALNGLALNQSMLLLFAHAVIRLGRVPDNLPLFDPLVHEKSSHRAQVLQLHQRWLRGENCLNSLKETLSSYLKLGPDEFDQRLKNSQVTPPRGLFGLLRRLVRL